MMRSVVSLALILFASISVLAQSSVEELPTEHAAAVADYLAANKAVTFRPQHGFSADYLKFITEELGKGFKMSYAAGDFNGDKVGDFAMLFLRDGKPEPSGATSEEHAMDHPLRLVVFNGEPGGKFRVAYTFDLMGPHAAYIQFADKRMNYGVFETDQAFYLVPVGESYTLEVDEEYEF